MTTLMRIPYDMPFTRVELILLALQDSQLQVLLAKRSEAPHKGRWAIPGGVLRIDMDQSLDGALRRVALERLNCIVPVPIQLCAVGGPKRDLERSTWALSVVYRASVDPLTFTVSAGKRIEQLKWFPISLIDQTREIAFDHSALVQKAVVQLRQDISELKYPEGLLPNEFTLGELQHLSELVLARRLDKSSFRRRIAERDLVEKIAGSMRTGANRPAQLYRIKNLPSFNHSV